MSILSFLFKPKKEMAKKNTKHVKVGKYTITPHAQNRIVDKTRKMDKIDVLDNLFTKPNGITKTKINSKNQPSYNRVGIRDFNLVNISKKGRKKKYVKRNSKK